MILDIPFYKQTTPWNCGPVALKMVLSYFGEDVEIETLEKRMDAKEGKGISTIQIAITAASLGYRTDFYSKHPLFNEENLKLDFYKKYVDIDLEVSKKLLEEAERLGVNIEEKELDLEELLSKVTEDSVPIVLVDWNAIDGGKGYQGHFLPLVGYDEMNVYVHDHGLKDPRPFKPIPRGIFDRARKAEGTDEDIVIVHRPDSG